MKSFKQFHQTQLIWKKLFEAADPKLVARVKKAIDEIEDNNLLNNVLETLFEPRLKTTVKELFDERDRLRIKSLEQSLQDSKPFLMDESVDFIKREEFNRGSDYYTDRVTDPIRLKFLRRV